MRCRSRSGPGRVAVAGLVDLRLEAVSLTWAPLSSRRPTHWSRLLLYLGRPAGGRRAAPRSARARAVEPVLALGALVVIGYGLAGRLLPGVVDAAPLGPRGAGRLEQPMTYWNAEGPLAAMGLVLCARLAGAPRAPPAMRVAAAAACAPLGMGVYLSYSRGAIAAAVVGLIVLLAFVPQWPQLRAAIALAAGVRRRLRAALPVPRSRGRPRTTSAKARSCWSLLVVVMLAAAVRSRRRPVGSAGRRSGSGGSHRRAAAARGAAAVRGAALVGAGRRRRRTVQRQRGRRCRRTGSRASRRDRAATTTGGSGWGVRGPPARGLGSGGFRVGGVRSAPWARPRLSPLAPAGDGRRAGSAGAARLGCSLGGVAAGRPARPAARAPLAAGACAGGAVWRLHATIDWDWQMPAVTLPAIVLAGGLIAASEAGPGLPARARAGSAA